MKKCYTCGFFFDKKQFNKNISRKDGLNCICKQCSRKRSRQYYEENKEKHKMEITKRRNRVVNECRKFILEYLSKKSCVDCGEVDVIVLTFDHRNPEEKEFNVSQMVNSGCSLKTIKTEINKCDVRCCNCHRRRTEKQYPSFKTTLKT